MKLTPMHIEFALVYHWSADPSLEIGEEKFDSPAGNEILHWLCDEGLINTDEGADYSKRRGTPRLAAFIEHLCQQPLPVQKWVQPECP